MGWSNKRQRFKRYRNATKRL